MIGVLFLFLVAAAAATTNAQNIDGGSDIPTPHYSRSRALFMTAHESNVPICLKGVLPAIAEVLGTTYDEIMEGLGGMLGGGLRLISQVQSTEDEQTDVPSEFDAADASFHKLLGLPQTKALGHAMLSTYVLSNYDALQSLSAIAGVDDVSDRIRSLGEQDETDENYRIRPLMGGFLLNVTSKTFAKFFSSLVLNGLGKNASGALGTPSGKLRSPMKNLLTGFCEASDYSKDFDTDSEAKTCAIMNVVGVVMACAGPDSFDMTSCNKESLDEMRTWMPETCETMDGTITMADHVAKFDFVDRRVPDENGILRLPLEFPQSVMDEEGFQMFLLYRASRSAMTFTSNIYPCGYETPIEPLIPGWNVEEVVTYYPVGSKKVADSAKDDYPLLMINRPDNKDEGNQCKVIIIIRGTASRYEWGVDLQYQLEPFISGINAHKGFSTLALSVMPNLENYLRSMRDEPACMSKGMDIIISGHSLGAGLSHVLSVLVAHSFPNDKVHSIGFATPNAFDESGREYFRRHVNGRSVAVDLDMVAVAPCGMEVSKYGQPRCNGVVDTGSGFLQYRNHAGTIKVDLMETVGGEDALNLTSLIGGGNIFLIGTRLDYDLMLPPPLQLGISHICAYTCKLSKYCKSTPSEAWECTKCPGAFGGIKGSITL